MWRDQEVSLPLSTLTIDLTNLGADVVVEVALTDDDDFFRVSAMGPDDFAPVVNTDSPLSWTISGDSAMAMPAPTNRPKPLPVTSGPASVPGTEPSTANAGDVARLSTCVVGAALGLASGQKFVGAAASCACFVGGSRGACVATVRITLGAASFSRVVFSGYDHLNVFACVNGDVFREDPNAPLSPADEWAPKGGRCLPFYSYKRVDLDTVCTALPSLVTAEQEPVKGDLLINGALKTDVSMTYVSVMGDMSTFTIAGLDGEFRKAGGFQGERREFVEHEGCSALYECTGGLCMTAYANDLCVATKEEAAKSTPVPVGPGTTMEQCTAECGGCSARVESCTSSGATCTPEWKFLCSATWGDNCKVTSCASHIGSDDTIKIADCTADNCSRFSRECSCSSGDGCPTFESSGASLLGVSWLAAALIGFPL